MEPYKPLGRGGYGRSTSQCNTNQCGMNQRSTNQCNTNQRSMNQHGMNINQMSGNHQGRSNNYNSTGCGCSEARNVSDNKNCDCRESNPHMRHMPLAMGYVPMQEWRSLCDPETALCQGTAFPELNLIFCGSRGKM